jgi:hypothetical protein
MSEPWEPPGYVEIQFRPGQVDYCCDRCGVFVYDIVRHNKHHYSLDLLKQSLVGISRLIAPYGPEGAILMPLQEDVGGSDESAGRPTTA